jgi:hypothetical protein
MFGNDRTEIKLDSEGLCRRISLAFELHRRDGCPESGILPYQEIDDDIERRTARQPASGRPSPAAESHQKRPRAPHKRRVAPGKPSSGKKASSTEQRPKRQKAAKQAKPAAGDREGSKAAKALGLLRRSDGRFAERANESHGLVGASCPWIPERKCSQAYGSRSRVRQERGQGAPLLSQRLNFHDAYPNSAAEISHLRRFLLQSHFGTSFKFIPILSLLEGVQFWGSRKGELTPVSARPRRHAGASPNSVWSHLVRVKSTLASFATVTGLDRVL